MRPLVLSTGIAHGLSVPAELTVLTVILGV
jgi:hypothetical protein